MGKNDANPSTSGFPSAHATTPEPPATLHITRVTLFPQQILHRVHLQDYQATQFNPGHTGDARFSPLQNSLGQPIPTLYAADTFQAALMESVFHDVPHAPGFKLFDRRKLHKQVHSRLQVTTALTLADLTSKPLRKLGVTRRQLIDTEKDQYSNTRRWAQAIHAQHPDVQGLRWTSRQDDSARAVMLFGDRIADNLLHQTQEPRSLLGHEQAYGEVLALAAIIGVEIGAKRLMNRAR